MNTDDELRDFFAAFAMNSLLQHKELEEKLKFRAFDMSFVKVSIAENSYQIADAMIEARKPKEPEVGIAAIKSRRKKDDQ